MTREQLLVQMNEMVRSGKVKGNERFKVVREEGPWDWVYLTWDQLCDMIESLPPGTECGSGEFGETYD